MRCLRPSATPCAAATPSASSGFELGHDLAPEQLQGAHGVLRREVAEGEDAEKIVRSSFLENLAYLLERGARRARCGGRGRSGAAPRSRGSARTAACSPRAERGAPCDNRASR